MSEKRTYPPPHPTSHLPDRAWESALPADDDGIWETAVVLAILYELGSATSYLAVSELLCVVVRPVLLLRYLSPGEAWEWARLHGTSIARGESAPNQFERLTERGLVDLDESGGWPIVEPTDRLREIVEKWDSDGFPRGPARFAVATIKQSRAMRNSARFPGQPLLIAGVES